MEEGKRSGRCYVAAFVVFAVAFALYVFEAAIMLINSAEVNVFSALLILSVVIGAIALALAVLSLTVFKSNRKIKVLFLILAAALILIASFFAVYGYGEKGGPEWLIKHDVGGFTFDAIVGAAALIVAIVALIVVSITATAEVRAEKRVINKQKRAEKKAENEIVKARNAEKAEEERKIREEERARLAEEKRLEAEKLAKERKIAAESRAEEKRLADLKAAEEKEEREREKAAKKAVAAEVASTAISSTAPADFINEDSQPEVVPDVSGKAERKLKIYPFVFAGISLILTFMFTFARWSGGETVMKIKFFLFSAICYQWVLLGIHILRNVKGGLRYLGILAILFAPLSYAMLAVRNTDETRFFVNMIMCLVPYNGNKFMLGYLIDTIFGSVSSYTTWEYYSSGMAISLWLGTLVYFLVPSKGKLSGVLGRDGWVRYFACALMTALVGFVVVALIVALVLAIIWGLVGSSSSSASSSYSGGSSGSSGSGEPTEEDDRFNKTVVLGDLRDVRINGDTVTDLNSGREYRIYNYHSNTGYFEDENRNVYYHSSNGEVVVTGEHRGYSESEYEADNRIHDEVGFTR